MATRKCTIEGCNRIAKSRGWCDIHYGRWHRHGDPSVVKVERHGHAPLVNGKRTPTPTYNTWRAIIYRCEDVKCPAYPRYGGSGIGICRRWRQSFSAFLEDMGERPPGTTIDRIDNGRGYEPGNCRWVDWFGQARNKDCVPQYAYGGRLMYLPDVARLTGVPRRTLLDRMNAGMSLDDAAAVPPPPPVSTVTFRGKTQTISQWAKESGIKPRTIRARLKSGWPVDRALFEGIHEA